MKMTKRKKITQLLEQIAVLVRDIYDLADTNISMISAVEKIGGTIVWRTPSMETVSSSIWKTKQNSFVIEISPDLSEQQTNVSIAERLGDLFINMGFDTDDELWRCQRTEQSFRYKDSIQEFSASIFALALLMPKDEYLTTLQKYTEADGKTVRTQKIANEFDVTVSPAFQRGVMLGLISIL